MLSNAVATGHFPDYEVRAYGSGVNGRSNSYSDLDLVAISKKKIDLKLMFQVEEAFEESTLPFRVDLLDWNAISESFHKIIEQKYEVIQARNILSNPRR